MSDDRPDPDGGTEPLAGPGQRLGGAFVDGATLQVAALLLRGVEPALAAALSAAVYLAYVVTFTALRGQTLGKAALGTRVVDAGTGRVPTLWQAATRAVVPLAGVVVDVALGAAVVGAFWVLTVYGWLLLDDHRRGLHDKAAGTVVVDVERSHRHRRAGAAAVVAAALVTAALVAVSLEELEDDGSLTAPAAAARPA